MVQLLVRGLSEEVVRRLRERAAASGRSVEAEHVSILEAAVQAPLDVHKVMRRLQDSPLVDLDADQLRDRADTGRDPLA